MTGPELPYTHVDDFYIDGRWIRAVGPERSPVTDPATEHNWGSVPIANTDDIDAAVNSARRAFDCAGWSDLTTVERSGILLRMADEIDKRSDVITRTITRENGSPVAETTGAAPNAASVFRYFASLADHIDAPDVRPFPNGLGETVVRHEAVGVCALIAPWNFPINLVVAKLAPALMAGCTVVIKPAPSTPLSIRFIVEAAAAAGVPDGVVNLITGEGQSGDLLVRHRGVDKVAFTGSTAVGRKIAAACGELLRPVTLELGGKSSAIVLPDADLDQMSSVLIRSCMRNTGQTCYIATRILAPKQRYDEVLDMVTATISSAKQGDPFAHDTVFGPSATQAQYKTVQKYLRSGVAEGARATTGGKQTDRGSGYFVTPTVFADVTADMTVAREEIFGPILSVLTYDTEEEAVALANNTKFGLGGIIFSSDQDHAIKIASQVDTGSIGINFFASNHSAPFSGRRDSGLGTEFGVEGLAAYQKLKSIHRR
ncbi:aldehyde dehydrogenase [Rhodococcus sp. SRB_17]|nr:aldehyde dehydrogenase [Rhodococcus sp. SRB_17]